MRVGVFLESSIKIGGGFQQAYSVVKLLRDNPLEGVEYVFFVFTRENEKILRDEGLPAVCVSTLWVRAKAKLFRTLLSAVWPIETPHCLVWRIDELLDRHGIDLVYFLETSRYSLILKRHPYIITSWDQCHRDRMEFPEVYSPFDQREFFNRHAFPKAIAVLVDAELSKQKMHERYGVDLERIHVAPFFPIEEQRIEEQGIQEQTLEDVCQKYAISLPFIFYPAQFWAHKNHVYILDALSRLRDRGVKIGAVFSGNDYGNEPFLREQTQKMGLADQVYFLGFVPRPEIAALYKKALALVMPTYFGPTNLPPLEAFALECPVCYPDLPGLRDQVGDAAFLMDLNDPESLCGIVNILLSDKQETARKIAAGKKRLELYSGQNYLRVLESLFHSYSRLLRCHTRS